MAIYKATGSKAYGDLGGVWRTIRGYKVFIKDKATAAEASKDNEEEIKKEEKPVGQTTTAKKENKTIQERYGLKDKRNEEYVHDYERGDIKQDELKELLRRGGESEEVIHGVVEANTGANSRDPKVRALFAEDKGSIEKRKSNEQIEKDFPDNLSDEVKEQARLLNTRGYDDIDDVVNDFAEEQGITRSEAKYALLKDEFKQRQNAYMDAKTSGSYSDEELEDMEAMAKDSYFKLQEFKPVKTLDGGYEKDNKGRIVSQKEYDEFREAYKQDKISKEDYKNNNYEALKEKKTDKPMRWWEEEPGTVEEMDTTGTLQEFDNPREVAKYYLAKGEYKRFDETLNKYDLEDERDEFISGLSSKAQSNYKAHRNGEFVLSEADQEEYDAQKKSAYGDHTYGMNPKEWKEAETKHQAELERIDKKEREAIDELYTKKQTGKIDLLEYNNKRNEIHEEWQREYNKELAKRYPDMMKENVNDGRYRRSVQKAIQEGINESPYTTKATKIPKTKKEYRIIDQNDNNKVIKTFGADEFSKGYDEMRAMGKELKAAGKEDGLILKEYRVKNKPETNFNTKIRNSADLAEKVIADDEWNEMSVSYYGNSATVTNERTGKKFNIRPNETPESITKKLQKTNEERPVAAKLSKQAATRRYNRMPAERQKAVDDLMKKGGISKAEAISAANQFAEMVGETPGKSKEQMLEELMKRGYSRTTAEKMLRQRKRK